MSDELIKNNNDDEISLKELLLKIKEWWNYLLSKWKIILLAGLVGGILGFTYASFQKPIYTAETTFVLEEGDSGSGSLGQYAGLASIAGVDLGSSGGGGIFQGENIIQLYKSNRMIEKTLLTIDTFNNKKILLVEQYFDFNQKKNTDFIRNIKFNNSTRRRLIDSILNTVISDIKKNYLEVEKAEGLSSIIMVKTTSPNELFSKSFTDNIVKNVNEFYVQTKTKKAAENLSILQRQSDSIKTVLNNSIRGVASSIDRNPNSNPAFQTLKVQSQVKQVDVQASGSAYQEIMKNLELAKISFRKEKPLIQVIDQSKFPLFKKNTGKLKFLILGSLISVILILIIIILKRLVSSILI